MTLADIKPNSRCRVVAAADEHREVQSRLFALGLYPGAWVDVLRRAPFGDPLQLKVGKSLLSIRAAEARLVHVETD
ncbi:MAG: FeoA family protein [Pseudomonadales bacterium]